MSKAPTQKDMDALARKIGAPTKAESDALVKAQVDAVRNAKPPADVAREISMCCSNPDYRFDHAKAEALIAQYGEARTKPLVEALERAREDMLGWQSYASDYFKEKHGAAADIEAIDEALAQEKGLRDG
jgi:hypothetical protein